MVNNDHKEKLMKRYALLEKAHLDLTLERRKVRRSDYKNRLIFKILPAIGTGIVAAAFVQADFSNPLFWFLMVFGVCFIGAGIQKELEWYDDFLYNEGQLERFEKEFILLKHEIAKMLK